jgi:pyruvate/2-oxoglutarate dehydrogenase complex dihydrolipoamide dehydrogenase (E3) component
MEEGSGPDSQRPPARTASELANMFVLAIRAGLPGEALKKIVFAYPTQISSLLWLL